MYMGKMADCIFCRIIRGEIPAGTVYEDDRVLVLEDINPQAPVHLLVIPRKHISTALDISAEDHSLIGHMFQAAGDIARKKGVSDSGFRLVMNTNADAGQTVYHIHLHILGGRPMHWPPG